MLKNMFFATLTKQKRINHSLISPLSALIDKYLVKNNPQSDKVYSFIHTFAPAEYRAEEQSITNNLNKNKNMRKFTLILASLFLSLGAWAQLADGVYTISNTIQNRGTMCYGTKGEWAGFGLANITLDGCADKSVTVEVDANKYWYVVTVEGKTYIYNVGQSKFLQSYQSGENASFGEDCAGFTMSEETHNSTSYALVGSNGKNLAFSCGWNPNQGQIRWTNYEKEACCLTFTKVEGAEATYKTQIVAVNKSLGNYFATPETDKYYKIKGEGELPWLTANTTANGNVVVSANEADAAVFLKTANGLQAVATGKYLGYYGDKYTYSDTELTIELRNTGDYLANYSNKYAIVSGGNYMFNNNNDGIVHESNRELDLPRLWAFTVVEARIGDTYYATFEAAMAAEGTDEVELLVEKSIVLNDGEAYTYTKDAADLAVEYTRPLIEGIWNPVYLPFDFNLESDKFEVAEFTSAEGATVTLTKLEANEYGYIDLFANIAYVVRPIGENTPLDLGIVGLISKNEEVVQVLGNGFSVRGNYSVLKGKNLGAYDRVVNGTTGNWGVLKEESTLKPFRLILSVPENFTPEQSAAISMRVLDNTTGVEETIMDGQEAIVIYDLMGRRVETMTEGGIYIVNGKKVIR